MAVVDSTERLEPVFALLDRFVTEERINGGAIAIAVAGKSIAEYRVGQAAEGRAVAIDTLWPLASISKLYTATAIMALVEQGILTLSTTVRSVLPAFTGHGREWITLRQLLTHTAGLIYEPPEMQQRLVAHASLDAIVESAYEQPLLFPPGSASSYSNLGFALAARVASVAAGSPFPELVRTLVLEPGGLANTFLPPPPTVYPRLAHIIGALGAGTERAVYNSAYTLDVAHPAFGVVTTVGDLLRFGLLFAPRGRHRILSAAAVRTMTTDQTRARPSAAQSVLESDSRVLNAVQPWGIGFSIRGPAGFPALASPGSFGHEGGSGCVLWIDPLHDVVVAFVSNLHLTADPDRFSQRLERVVNVTLACLTRRALACLSRSQH